MLFYIGFVAVSAILHMVFFPFLMNVLLLPITKVGDTVPGLGLLNWSLCFQNLKTTELTLTGAFLLIALLIFVYSSIKKDDKSIGEEYGTAKWLSEDLFSKLVPHYIFHENEYDYPHPDIFAGFQLYEENSVLDVLEVNDNEQ